MLKAKALIRVKTGYSDCTRAGQSALLYVKVTMIKLSIRLHKRCIKYIKKLQ
jgi:hypothetical protein